MSYSDFICKFQAFLRLCTAFYKDEIEGKLNRREVIAARHNKPSKEDQEKEAEEATHPKAEEGEGEGAEGEGDGKERSEEAAQKAREAAKKAEEERKRNEEAKEEELKRKDQFKKDFYDSWIQRKYQIDEKLYRTVLSKSNNGVNLCRYNGDFKI